MKPTACVGIFLLVTLCGRGQEESTEFLIDGLSEITDEGLGYSSTVSGGMFLPLQSRGKWDVGILGKPPPVSSEAMRKIVKRGAAAVPALLAHLGDTRPTKLRPAPAFGSLWFPDEYDYNAETTSAPKARVNREAKLGEYHPSRHQVTVGDLCFVALGQIVNRSFSATRYQPTAIVVINSPSYSSELRKAILNEWGVLTPDRHRESLVSDFRKPDCEQRRIGAGMRLAYYYPDTLEEQALAQLASGRGAEQIPFIKSLVYDHSVKIDRAVRDILVETDDESLAISCTRRLVGRGYDRDIEAACRRFAGRPSKHERDSFAGILAKLGWTPLHVAVEMGLVEAVEKSLARGAAIDAGARNGKTALHVAAELGHGDIIGLLLSRGADLEARDGEGRTPVQAALDIDQFGAVEMILSSGAQAPDIRVAALAGRTAQVRKLLEEKPESVNSKTAGGATPLLLAVREGHVETTKLLLQNGADIRPTVGRGMTALHLAVHHGGTELVALLLSAGLDVRARMEHDGYEPLHIAAIFNHREVAELLLEKGAAVDAVDDYGLNTPLHWAAEKGNRAVAELLLSRKADLRARDKNEETPLWRAARAGHVGVVDLLAKAGADLKEKDKYGRSAIHFASEGGHVELVEYLLDHGVMIEETQNGDITPLHLAAENGHLDLVRKLVGRGANVNARDFQDKTALRHAAQLGDPAMVSCLLDHGADVDLGKSGTPLHVAVRCGHLEVVRLLLERKPDIHAIDEYRRTTAIEDAAQTGREEITRLLIEHGALPPSERWDIGYLFLGLIVSILAASLLLFMPLVRCPMCRQSSPTLSEGAPCARCGGVGRLTLIQRWRGSPSPPVGS